MTYQINVEEKIVKDKIQTPEFCDITSTKEGIITKIITSKGVPLVEINEHVNVGDTLISGIISYNEEIKNMVCAKGEVYAKTWYEVSISIPKTYIKKEKTGKGKYNIYIKKNDKTTKILKNKFKNPIIEKKNKFKIFGITIDIVEEYESKINKYTYKENEIENKIQELLNSKLKPILKDNNHILEQKVLKKNDFNSTIDIELFIVVEELISSSITN